MKKFLMLLFVIGIILSITGCSKNDKDEEKDTIQEGLEVPTVTPSIEGDSDEEDSVKKDFEEKGENLIPGGYFDEEISNWGVYTESGGVGTISINLDEQLEVAIDETGSVGHGVQVHCDGFELLKNGVYEISFDISSSVDRTMDWRIQINGEDYRPYVSRQDIGLSNEMQHFTYTFTMEEESDPAPRMCFNLGFYANDGQLGGHKVLIDNVELFLKDDSKTEETRDEDMSKNININQIGYRPGDTKLAIFRDSGLDSKFDVINVETGETVFTGDIYGEVETPSAGENVAHGDFSPIKEPGTYKLVAAKSGESYEFTIADNVYDDIFNDIVKMLYLQRCGSDLEAEYAGDFAHSACHSQEAIIYGTSDKKDVSGGWHDAGDYGRYIVPAAKAVADILLAYEDYGPVFSDNVGIPESGNGVPDILDEARYELEWMLKMQDEESGGVYHKVTTKNFTGMVMPETLTNQLYISPISNSATGDFAAVMAMAGRIYKPFDEGFADRCLASAKKALAYMEDNKGADVFRNPSDISTGEYSDTSDTDEYFWALSELYKTTGDSAYENKLASINFNSLRNGLGWQEVSFYGIYAYLTAEKQDNEIKNKLIDSFKRHLSSIEKNIESDGYFSSMGRSYPWGSNMTLANDGMAMLMADKIFDTDEGYVQLAKKQLDYLLGANSTSYCFVTGHGSLSPQSTHHRPSEALGITMDGMLVGGANSNLEDPYAKSVLAGRPPAKCYVDNSQSYSCNEITIYWNSPLIYLMAGLMSSQN